MNRLLILLFGMVTFAAHAQVPDYVPTDGLVAWYPFNGNANDESGNAYDGEVNGALLTADRFLEPNSAYSFSGNCQDRIDILVPEMTENTSFSVSFWAKRNGTGCYNPRMWEFYGGSRTTQCGWFNDWDSITFSGFPIIGANLENEIWYHFALTNTGTTWEAYFNGEFNNLKLDSSVINSPDLAIGRMNHPAWDSFNGEIDDFAIWDRALSAEEVLALYNAQLPIPGCTDFTACNFNEEATDDDGSCVYPLFGNDCETGSAACGEGTVWDSANQSCVAWNDCPSDLDGDGVIGVSDLMHLLADFGTDCPIEANEWTCGDPVLYHGYNYETVLIGEQCWFAENCRYMETVSPPSLGFEDDSLAHAYVYGYDGASVDEAMTMENYALHGVLYNQLAAESWDICPTGWHVPFDTNIPQQGDFEELKLSLPADAIGSALKASPTDSTPWDGDNSSGFNGIPSGNRSLWWSGEFSGLDVIAFYWSQSGWSRRLDTNDENLALMGLGPAWGLSVRCVAD